MNNLACISYENMLSQIYFFFLFFFLLVRSAENLSSFCKLKIQPLHRHVENYS